MLLVNISWKEKYEVSIATTIMVMRPICMAWNHKILAGTF